VRRTFVVITTKSRDLFFQTLNFFAQRANDDLNVVFIIVARHETSLAHDLLGAGTSLLKHEQSAAVFVIVMG